MKHEKILLDMLEKISPILHEIKTMGGTAYLVGGSVRDLVLARPLKDFDIEVHGLDPVILESILEKFGTVVLVGKQFGVLRLFHLDIDWSLPRRDSIGRKPTIFVDPTMTLEHACRRRDITINAMALNLHEYHEYKELRIIDLYGGLEDIKNKRLRAVDSTLFTQDPLRFFRVMQFIGRFEMQPDLELTTICKTMSLSDDTGPLARERIFEEIKKLCLKSRRPSLGFRWLEAIGRLHEIFPELYALIGVPQRKDYHPEGDVFEHSMQALDAAAQYDGYQDEDEKFLITIAALCHDLGKPMTTDENLHCHGHDHAGVMPAQSLLKRITDDIFLSKAVSKLVRYHLAPFMLLREGAGARAYKRLAAKLAPEVTMRQLGLVALADHRGRNSESNEPLVLYQDKYDQFIAKAQEANVVHKPEAPVLLGRHLLDDIPAGPKMGKLLDKAYEIQIDEGITDVEELKRRVLK